MDRSAFGAELRRRRQQAGLSLTQLSQQIHYSKGYLSKIESGDKAANPTLARLCDAAVVANGALVALAADTDTTRAGPADDTDGDGNPWLLRMEPTGTAHFQRSGATAFDDSTALALSPGVTGLPADPEALITLFSARFDQSKALGQIASPALVLPSLITELHMLRGLARAGRDEHGAARLWLLAAQFADFAGWTVQDAGDDRHATWWTNRAVELAVLGGDDSMRPFALVRRAEMAMYSEDARTTIELAQQARHDPSATARVRGLAFHREAQGYALLGAARECFEALGNASALLDEAAQALPDAPVLGPTRTPDLHTMVRGWCLLELGRPAEAAQLLDSGIGEFAVGSARARVRFGLRAALAHAVGRDVERACEVVRLLADDLWRVDSAIARLQVSWLARELRRHSTLPCAQDVLPVLADLLRGPAAA